MFESGVVSGGSVGEKILKKPNGLLLLDYGRIGVGCYGEIPRRQGVEGLLTTDDGQKRM